jgi:Zn-dependent peptidase ImmA (M78 family)
MGQDFRTLPEGTALESEGLLDTLLRDVHTRQGLVRAALEDVEEDEQLTFVGSARIADGVDALARTMGETIGFSAGDFHAQKSIDAAFAALRAATERAGVFVLLMGNLGSHHTKISERVFRGFSLADQVAPFIVINENDSRAAWSFTLLHELAHIFLGQTGVSGYGGESEIEKFCDSVAARFLLNPKELFEITVRAAADTNELAAQVAEFSRARNLSRKMVAYNLLRAGLIGGAVYRRLSDTFDQERLSRKRADDERSGGADYYVVRRHRVGSGLITLASRMVASGALSTTRAARILGVKPTGVMRLVGNAPRVGAHDLSS